MTKSNEGPYRLYAVTLRTGPHPYDKILSARSRSQARYLAYLDIADLWSDLPFKKFLYLVDGVRLALIQVPAPLSDGYEYVRRHYGLNIRIGQRVRLKKSGQQGVVTYPGSASSQYVYVGIDGYAAPVPVHPHYIEIEESFV